MKFSYLLEEYRKRRNLTASDLAGRLNLSAGYITNLERGHRVPPPIQRCEEIADALNLSPVERSLFINAAMEERLDQDEIQWVASKTKSSSGVHEPIAPYSTIPDEILKALEDPAAVAALLAVAKNKKDIKDNIKRIIELLPKMDVEKRKAILALCQ
jgi:transcriptional regulator with XRE-family HTH domain